LSNSSKNNNNFFEKSRSPNVVRTVRPCGPCGSRITFIVSFYYTTDTKRLLRHFADISAEV